MNPNQKIGWKTAAALVISSMIGTGIFTSLGGKKYKYKRQTQIQ